MSIVFSKYSVALNSLFLYVLSTQSVQAEEITVNSVQVTRCETITLDGVLDDDCWKTTVPVTHFERFIPTDGGEPPGETKVHFAQNEKFLFIGIEISGANYPIQARIAPREDVNNDDQIGIYIDTVGDGRTGYIFYHNALGIQQDMRYSNGRWMGEWNTIYNTKATLTDTGYTLEISMPFSSLQYPDPDSNQTNWKVMITRKIPTEGSKYSYPKLQRNHPQMFLQAVPLQNLQPPAQGAGIWIQPTISLRHGLSREEDALHWIEKDQSIFSTARPSLDIRWGITPDTAVVMTTNPDFSQVEGDVRQINLNQRFAFYYPERRTFFLSNIDFFQDNANSLYTRSINNPLTAIKLAGRENGWNFGLLHSIDQSPSTSVHEFGSTGFTEEELRNTWASNSYFRMRRDAFGSGFIGVFLADKRIIDNYLQSKTDNTHGYNNVSGLDLRSNITKETYIEAMSSVALTGNDHSNMQGSAHTLTLSKSPDIGWGYTIKGNVSSKDYRQEMGFLNQSGLQIYTGELFYLRQFGDRTMLRSSILGENKREFDRDGYSKLYHSQNLTLRGVHTISMDLGWYQENYKEYSVETPFVSFSASARMSNQINAKLTGGHTKSLDYASGSTANNENAGVVLLWRPRSNLRFDLDMARQWYTITQTDTQTIQRVYTRCNWQFSPYLGLRLIDQTVWTNTSAPTIFASALLSYVKNPGNEWYIGGTWNVLDQADTSTFQQAQYALDQQLLFAKWTHLFQY